MLNQIVLVGRLYEMQVNLDKKTIITIESKRNYKNENGDYDTDYIDFTLWNGIAEQVKEYCKKGDVIGIKGRIQTTIVNDIKETELIAEKISFLSTKSEEVKEKINEDN